MWPTSILQVTSPGRWDFEENLQDALQNDMVALKNGVRPLESPKFAISINQQPGSQFRPEGSGVDLDQEMVVLSKTVIAYDAMTTLTNGLYNRVRLAVKEGKL